MEDGRIAKVNIDDWAFIPMIPFGLLAGYWGTMEVRITALAEEGFQIRLAHPASEAQKQEPPELAFYDYHTIGFLSAMHAWYVKNRSSFLRFIRLQQNWKHTAERYSTLRCNTAAISAGRRKVTTQCSRRR